jgi:hypothetical protein
MGSPDHWEIRSSLIALPEWYLMRLARTLLLSLLRLVSYRATPAEWLMRKLDRTSSN